MTKKFLRKISIIGVIVFAINTLIHNEVKINADTFENNIKKENSMLKTIDDKLVLEEKEIKLKIGDRKEINYQLTSSNYSKASLIWESDDEAIVKVYQGKLFAVAEGNTTVTLKTKDNNLVEKCTITVEENHNMVMNEFTQNIDDEFILEIGKTYEIRNTTKYDIGIETHTTTIVTSGSYSYVLLDKDGQLIKHQRRTYGGLCLRPGESLRIKNENKIPESSADYNFPDMRISYSWNMSGLEVPPLKSLISETDTPIYKVFEIGSNTYEFQNKGDYQMEIYDNLNSLQGEYVQYDENRNIIEFEENYEEGYGANLNLRFNLLPGGILKQKLITEYKLNMYVLHEYLKDFNVIDLGKAPIMKRIYTTENESYSIDNISDREIVGKFNIDEASVDNCKVNYILYSDWIVPYADTDIGGWRKITVEPNSKFEYNLIGYNCYTYFPVEFDIYFKKKNTPVFKKIDIQPGNQVIVKKNTILTINGEYESELKYDKYLKSDECLMVLPDSSWIQMDDEYDVIYNVKGKDKAELFVKTEDVNKVNVIDYSREPLYTKHIVEPNEKVNISNPTSRTVVATFLDSRFRSIYVKPGGKGIFHNNSSESVAYYLPKGIKSISDKNSNIVLPTMPSGQATEDIIPIGKSFQFGLPKYVPVKISTSGNKFEIVVGVEGDNFDDMKKYAKAFYDGKELQKEILKSMAILNPYSIADDFQSSTCTIIGYAEGTIDEHGKYNVINGGIRFGAQADLKSPKVPIALPVPIPLNLRMSLKGELNNSILITDIKDLKGSEDSVKYNGIIDASLAVQGDAILGLDKLLSATLYGNLTLGLESNFRLPQNSSIKLTGKTGLDLEALFMFSLNLEWPKDGKELVQLYPANNINDLSLEENFTDSFKLLPRDYAKKQSVWLGSKPSLRELNTTNEENKVNELIKENIFPNSESKIVSFKDKKILVWLDDNRQRSAENRTQLLYSIYDNKTDIWSTPKSISNLDTADFYFDLKTDGDYVYIAWQNSNKLFNENVDIKEVAATSEIYVAKFNEVTSNFEDVNQITSNNKLDMLPNLYVKYGKMLITWSTNSENDIFGIEGKNYIMYSLYDGLKWSEPAVATETNSKIISQSMVFDGKNGHIVYQVETDNDIATIDDHELKYINISGEGIVTERNITNNSQLDSNPQLFINNERVELIWYSNDNINRLIDFNSMNYFDIWNNADNIPNDNFKVIGNENKTIIIWIEEEESIKNIYGSIYNSDYDRYSEPIKLTDNKQRIKNASGTIDEDGKITLAYNEALQQEKDFYGEKYIGNGQSNLKITTIKPVEDIAIKEDSITFNKNDFLLNNEMKIDFKLENLGETVVKNFDIELFDGNPNENGKLLMRDTITKVMLPGEISDEEIYFIVDELKAYNLYLKVIPELSADIDLTNNITNFVLGDSDLNVNAEYTYYDEDSHKIISSLNIDNIGVVNSENQIIRVKDESGEVIFSKEIEEIKGKSAITAQLEIDGAFLSNTSKDTPLFIELVNANSKEELINCETFVVTSIEYFIGDINKDDVVNILDVSTIAFKYNINSNNEAFDKKCDINKDGVIDIYDLVSVSKRL